MDDLRRLCLKAAAASPLACAAGAAVAQTGEPSLGREFRAVNPQQSVEAPAGRIEVLEFFAYWCPHCHSLEPELAE